MILKIHDYLTNPEPLRRKARTVLPSEFGSPEFQAFVADLTETLLHYNALGLAATQVQAREGARPPGDDVWRVLVMRGSHLVLGEHLVVIANPFVETRGAPTNGPEACLSFRSVQIDMRAPDMICGRFDSQTGVARRIMLCGTEARCFQHETEHLDGRLLIDRMKKPERQRFLQAVGRAKVSM